MSYLAIENTTLAVMQEAEEGTYLEPDSGNDFISPLSDGLELSGAKGLVERNILNSSIGKSTPRIGQKSASGSIGLEWKAGQTEGAKPELDSFLMAALGGSRQLVAEVTTKTGNTATKLQIQDMDVVKFQIGDIVLVKAAAGYHVSPIIAIDTTEAAASITLLLAYSAAYEDNVVIGKFTTYYPVNSGHKTLSITKFLEGKILEAASGMRTSSMSLNSFTTGEIASLVFAMEGISYYQEVEDITLTPVYDTSKPPLILSACVFQNGTSIHLNELSLTLENAIGWITSTCSKDGRIASRITNRSISGSMNPYKSDISIQNFTNFETNTPFSLFLRAYNPTSTLGQFNEICSIYLPNCITTELTVGNQEGILTDQISFSADRGADGLINEIFMGFI